MKSPRTFIYRDKLNYSKGGHFGFVFCFFFKYSFLYLWLLVGIKMDFTHLNYCIYPQEFTERSTTQWPLQSRIESRKSLSLTLFPVFAKLVVSWDSAWLRAWNQPELTTTSCRLHLSSHNDTNSWIHDLPVHVWADQRVNQLTHEVSEVWVLHRCN